MSKVTHLTLDEEGGLKRQRIHLREISGDADAPLETVGQDLRAARLRRGDDLATVSKALKIRKDHLEALEEDRLEALPGRTYAVGFVRTYADYLGLDAVQCVERFKAEIAGRESGPGPVTGLPAHDEERKLPQGWTIMAAIVVCLVLFGIYQLAVSANRMLNAPVAPVPASIAPKKIVHFQKPPPPPPVVQQPAQAVPAPGAPEAGTVVAGQSAKIAPPGATPAAPLATQTATAQPPAPAVAIPQGQTYGSQNANARVVLHVLQVTRVLVQGDDGTTYINRVLKPGDSYRVPDHTGLTLTTPNGGAVEVELDGQSLGRAGHVSQMIEAMSLDPQDVVDRMH